ncbi:MAG: anti-sigma factor family protein [Alphaproteobacteria bacterium]
MTKEVLSDEELWEYIDGGLGKHRRAQIADILASNPEQALREAAMRRENELLSGIGDDVLGEPVPDRLRAVLQSAAATEQPPQSSAPEESAASEPAPKASSAAPRSPWFMQGLAYAATIGIGVVLGWNIRGNDEMTVSELDRALQQIRYVNDFYSAERDFPFDFTPDRSDDLGAWIERVFGRPVPPPDLTEVGYGFRGARILPGQGGRFGYYEYESETGARMSLAFWSTAEAPKGISVFGNPTDDPAGRSTRYWVRPGLGFALASDPDESRTDEIAEQVDRFFEAALGL